MESERQPDQTDVARLAGVSLGSVSTAINQPHLVSAKMLQRVETAIEQLGYVPNRTASSLRKGGSNRIIGLVIPEVTNAFYAAIVDAVVDAADEHGYGVTLCVSHEDVERERRHFEMLAQQRAAGALVVPIDPTVERLSRLHAVGTRLIMVDRAVSGAEGCSVSVDDVQGGRLAARHLLAGRLASDPTEGITVVNGRRGIPQCDDRWEGVHAAAAHQGVSPDTLSEITVDAMTIEAGLAVAGEILRAGLPRRVFGINDQLATGVMQGFERAGLSLPDDARVVGYGDLGLDNSHRLSTIGQPKHDMGQRAVELLLAELNDGDAHSHSTLVFEPHLIPRASSALPD